MTIFKGVKQFLVVIILLTSCLIYSKTIYVATNGNDSNDGSINNPYKTFSKAVSVMSAGDVCIIRGGVYEQQLLINKNGNSSNYLTFKAMDGEKVDIRATSKLNNWQLHSGNIYKTSVNMSIESRFRAVYHNENYMDLARWPNNADDNRWTIDCASVTGGDNTHFLVNNMPNINWTGGMVYYLATHSGTSWTRPITSSTSNRINHAGVDLNDWPFSNHHPQRSEGNVNNPHGQLFLFNKLEALDNAREWFYDDSTKLLYLQTSDGTKPANNTVEYATRKYAVELRGDYIKLDGISIFGGSLHIFNNADNNQVLNCTVIHGSEGHDSLTNSGAQVGEASMEIKGDNTLISGCTINHSSVSGIQVAAWAAKDCVIENNIISNTDYVGIHASPIRTSANNMKILKNTIFNTGRDGMYVAGQNCEVAYNDVSASQKINSDSGVFYTVGNTSNKNNVIHHNWFHDAIAPSYSHNSGSPGKAAGIYLDNDSKGYVVHHNVVWNVSWSAYQINWNNVNLDFYHNTIWNAERAMDSWVNGRAQSDNKIYNNYSNVGSWHSGNGSQEFDIQNNIINSTPLLEDPGNLNFMPKPNSSLINTAQIISGFDKSFKGTAPDIGAYEFGGTNWTAGVNAIEDTGEPLTVENLEKEEEFKIYPNPVSSILNFTFNDESSNLSEIKIFSILGKVILTKYNQKNIDISNLQVGTYFIRISKSNKVYNTMFIKE